MSKVRIAIGAVVGLAILITGGTWLYIHVIEGDAPKKLTLDDSSSSAARTTTTEAGATTQAGSSSGDSADGNWTASSRSIVGYRVKEVLFGQSTEAVGRTSAVTGSMTISGTTVSKADFTVDMTTVHSDKGGRDGQFQGRIMQTSRFPTSTFKLTSPIDLGSIPADGAEVTVTAKGDLTLKGTTKSIELKMTAKKTGSTISTLSDFNIVFADWGIVNPTFGPAQTEDHGLLEIKLVFEKA